MDNKMKDSLVIDHFIQAFGKEQPPTGLIVHTDQVSQFTGCNFTKFGAIRSNIRKGNPYDNSVMESFYRTIKRELILVAKY